jgi:hypothetical protein
MSLANAVKGARHSGQEITWTDESGLAVDLTGATLTGFIQNQATGRIRVIDGDLDLVTADEGVFSWDYGVNDVLTAGKFIVQFVATYGDGSKEKTVINEDHEWTVSEAYDAISNGDVITMYIADTWNFTIHNLEDISSYEVLTLIVRSPSQLTDNDTLLYVRSDDGLIRIGGAAPAAASGGSLTIGTGQVTALISMSETAVLTPSQASSTKYRWYVKAFDITPNPDRALTLATGQFVLNAGGVLSVTP